MTRDQIITSLWEAPEITEAIAKMEPAHLRDDLRAEMFFAVCKLPEVKLVAMFESGNLKWYMLRTMLNMIQSDRSTFHAMYRRGGIEIEDIHPEDLATDDVLKERVNPAIDALGFYEQGIFRLFNELGCSHKKVHEATAIPLRTVKWQIAKIRAKLKKTLRADANALPMVHRSLHRVHH